MIGKGGTVRELVPTRPCHFAKSVQSNTQREEFDKDRFSPQHPENLVGLFRIMQLACECCSHE